MSNERVAERGSVVVMVVLALLAVSAMATAMLVTSQGDHLIAANERDAERARHASKAGLSYAYHQFQQGLIEPTPAGAAFDSLDTAVTDSLQGAAFTGKIYDLSSAGEQGQLYKIESTGTFNRGIRKTELILQLIPESLKYGMTAFDDLNFLNPNGLSGPSYKFVTPVFADDDILIPNDLTIDGTVIGSDDVVMNQGSTIKGDVFTNSLSFSGVPNPTVEGDVKLLAAVSDLVASAGSWDRVDDLGNKYAWYGLNSAPGIVSGTGTILGTQSSYAIQNDDPFRSSIYRPDGTPLSDPDLNVTRFVAPPLLDYQAMKAEADENEATYFVSNTAVMTYLASKKVVETIDGKTVTTIKVGTPTAPEFIYVAGDFELVLDPSAAADDPSLGILKADGFHLEGGIHAAEDFEFYGPAYNPALHPAPPSWYQLKINALPHCYPAIIGYREPATGTIATWTPADTLPMTDYGGDIEIQSGVPYDGFVYINGVTYAEHEVHFNHPDSSNELIRLNGAVLGWDLFIKDYLDFTYDPAVRCTRFLVAREGTSQSQVVSFREVR